MVVDYSRFDNLDDSEDEAEAKLNGATEDVPPGPRGGGKLPSDVGCKNCGAKCEKLLLCSICKATNYCSPGCQKADWSMHKRICRKAESMEDKLKKQFPGMQCFGGSSALSGMMPPVQLKAADAKADDKNDGAATPQSAQDSKKPAVKYAAPSTRLDGEAKAEEGKTACDGKGAAPEASSTAAAASASVCSGNGVACENCQQPCAKPLRCSKCKDVSYCSAKCQKEDWSYHKRNCLTSKTVICKCCGATIKDGVIFCRSCGLKRHDLDQGRPAESMQLRQQAGPDKVEDEDIKDWYRHREWQPPEGKKDFKPTRIDDAAAGDCSKQAAPGTGSPAPRSNGGYAAHASEPSKKKEPAAEGAARGKPELTGEVTDMAEGLTNSILVNALNAASGFDDTERDVSISENAAEAESPEVEGQPAADENASPAGAEVRQAPAPADRRDMLSWWEERLSALEVHKADGDLSFEMDPPVILSGEAWASSSSSSKRCDVNISCQLSFSVDMMEKLTDVLKDFLKEVEAKAHGREATNCELLD
eukprot:TRINITY_DN35203_c0_g1_i2.p1 TRINITY_DN35203_c0_g1~~TRINITY_DN35203_c0_g1_i2.p1  ORF type:complete len:533 (-),score=177.91 TRINITY_DN35203_c0_g1_i2:211-1809(-)